MKKRLAIVLIGVLALAFSGCGSNESSSQSNGQQAQTESAEITIAGSTSVQPISEALAEAFMAKNPNIKVNVQGGGSGAGIKAAQEGTANIGSSSRELKSEEKGLTETVICKDGIAIVVNAQNAVTDLNLEQIKGIYSGKITNWKKVGGADQTINVVTREAGSGTRGAFEELVMGKDTVIIDKAIVQNSTGAARAAVTGDANAIAYISMASLDDTVKAVTVEGVKASAENILNDTYKVQRPFLYLTKEAPAGAVKTYIDFVMSNEGQSIIEKEGLVLIK
ncbi:MULTISPECIES: phosphate ABC transporter substrate-binding protein [unclassified Dehalobacter]|uniref:phosphate ABC transporter substrate-binding protein n=1 Tax=unclassified Dehalobacter TaxID=2635733 RepID=UPI000E6BBE9D|nr:MULTISPECIES: phosphate ABC transporter substrate-binding protein [unclassified Dehalobacter]RJE47512.1 phosphate-binding protein [Dehalobacter sp. MCB1]TCX48677.1 phosphate-binding protein [Dehalobacter sp. 14DCB1]TCX56275.1 phosphate-binding protein [Dehalobacter sp. 12DCB1]